MSLFWCVLLSGFSRTRVWKNETTLRCWWSIRSLANVFHVVSFITLNRLSLVSDTVLFWFCRTNVVAGLSYSLWWCLSLSLTTLRKEMLSMVSPFLISDEFIYKVLVVSYNLEILVRDDINISFGKVVTFHKKWIPFCGICIFTKLYFVCCSHGVGSIIGETGQWEALKRAQCKTITPWNPILVRGIHVIFQSNVSRKNKSCILILWTTGGFEERWCPAGRFHRERVSERAGKTTKRTRSMLVAKT